MNPVHNTGAVPPLVLLDPDADLLVARRRYQDQGWLAQTTWELPDEPWDCASSSIVCVGAVVNSDDGARAVWAAARGAGVVAAVDATTPLGLSLFGDLATLGDVGIEGASTATTADLGLDSEQLEVIRLLAEGFSIPQVAEQLYLSTRTTERRLAAARTVLGVRSTAQAVVAFLTAATDDGERRVSGGIQGEQT